jgi:hypothetical protein
VEETSSIIKTSGIPLPYYDLATIQGKTVVLVRVLTVGSNASVHYRSLD